MKELFLACALSLPVGSFHLNGNQNEEFRELFIHEYEWISTLLERSYPGHEFLIIKIHEGIVTPPGWEEIAFQWRGHMLYKRLKQNG